MPSNKINNDINVNNVAYVGDEDQQTRRFIRNRNYSKKDDKLSKDAKSHKKEHQKHVTKRIQERIAIKQKTKELEKLKEKEEPIVYRVPQPKKRKTTDLVVKGQPKRKAQENWNDQWEDTELGETLDLEEARDAINRDEDDYFCAVEMPKEIADIELQRYQRALSELDKINEYFGDLAPTEMTWKLQEKITSYENKQRLKELKAGLTMTLAEYEKEKVQLNKVWTAYKKQRIPRHLFDGTRQYNENKLLLEMCELAPVINTKLRAVLTAKIQDWENYLDQYYAQQEAEMDEYFAQQEAETEKQELLQMIENSQRLQVFVSNLQKD